MSTQTTTLTGHSIIAGRETPGNAGTTRGIDPATNAELEPAYTLIDEAQLAEATAAAEEAVGSFSILDPETHAGFLERVAANIEAVGDELVDRASTETGLPVPRLQGELARTTGQLRLFAYVVRQGDHRGVRIEPPSFIVVVRDPYQASGMRASEPHASAVQSESNPIDSAASTLSRVSGLGPRPQ